MWDTEIFSIHAEPVLKIPRMCGWALRFIHLVSAEGPEWPEPGSSAGPE